MDSAGTSHARERPDPLCVCVSMFGFDDCGVALCVCARGWRALVWLAWLAWLA